jgi:hypothetical protein
LGLSAAIPIAGDLFLLGNISAMYLWGKFKYYNPVTPTSSGTEDIKEYGINSSLSLAYYIAPASTTISLGGRYQYYKGSTSENNWEFKNKLYGITLTATYTFSI